LAQGDGRLGLQIVEQHLGLHCHMLRLVLLPAKKLIVPSLPDLPHKCGDRS
jgi:hypothetical protein